MQLTDQRYIACLRAEREAVETFYRAFSEQKLDLVDTVLATDWDDIPLAPGQVSGPQGAKFVIRSVAQAFPDMKVIIHDLLQEPGKIAVRAEITGTHLGTLFGIAATGKRASLRLHEFYIIEDGLITRTWHLEDWFGLFLQLGQFPVQA